MLTPDLVWKIYQVESYSDFCEKIARPFILPTALPQGFKEDLNIVHKLLVHSYYEPKFVDVAMLQATVSLEKILRHHYSQTFNSNKKLNLDGLIKHFTESNHFEYSNSKEVLDIFRKLRNKKVHDLEPSGGLIVKDWIYTLVNFINDLYEDPQLRANRLLEKVRLQNAIDTLFVNGATLEYKQNTYILFDTRVVFVNNKLNPATIWLALWCTFDLEPYRDGVHHYLLSPLKLAISSPNLLDTNRLEAITTDNDKITIKAIISEPFKSIYSNWMNEAQSLPNLDFVMKFKYNSLSEFTEKALADFYTTP